MYLQDTLQQKIAIHIENVVSTAVLNQTIPITKVIKRFPKSKYNPEKFPGAIIRLDNPKSVILAFKSGSIVCTGTQSEETAKKAIHAFESNLCDIVKLKNMMLVQNAKTQNIVASCNLGKKIHLEQAARMLPRSLYEPEQFPAVMHRVYHPRTVVLIFASGRIVCVGAKSTEDLHSSVHATYMRLEEMDLIVND